VKTGLNEAFIVDNTTKEALIREDPRSAELLKPLVRGKDVNAWSSSWAGCWLIATFPAARLSIEKYPAVQEHLASFGRRIHQTGEPLPAGGTARKRTPHQWWELQDTCAYHADFAKPKLLWIELVNRGRFALDESGDFHCDATAFMATGSDLRWLCAVLNSTVARWWVSVTAPTSGAGTFRWKKAYVLGLPVPRPTQSARAGVARLVGPRSSLEPGAHSLAQELDLTLDSLVATAYGLTEEDLRLARASLLDQ